MLDADHHRRITEAVEAAEARTSGEIACILTQEVSAYPETTLAWAAGGALIVPPLALWLGLRPDTLNTLMGDWSAASPGTMGPALAVVLAGYVGAQALIFGAVALLLSLVPSLRRALTPRVVKNKRVKRAALQYFLALGVHLSEERTGVLIFASLHDRQVEILADAAIHRKVGQTAWDQATAAVVSGMRDGDPGDGFVRAVEICGAALAEHYPAQGPRANHLADGLVEF